MTEARTYHDEGVELLRTPVTPDMREVTHPFMLLSLDPEGAGVWRNLITLEEVVATMRDDLQGRFTDHTLYKLDSDTGRAAEIIPPSVRYS